MEVRKKFAEIEKFQEAIHSVERNLNDAEKKFLDMCDLLNDDNVDHLKEASQKIAALRILVSKIWRDEYLSYYRTKEEIWRDEKLGYSDEVKND